MLLSAIVAHDRKMAIGKDGRLPWHLPKDLARFKALTMRKPIIMGRRTFESIGRALPGRTNIVMSRRKNLCLKDVLIAENLAEAVKMAQATGAEEAFFVGGAMVYREALPLCHKVYATEVDVVVDGDAWFPALEPDSWRLIAEEHVPADDQDPFAQIFRVYESRPDPPA